MECKFWIIFLNIYARMNDIVMVFIMPNKTTFNYFDVHVTVHRDKFLTMKPTRYTDSLNLFLDWNSTCFGQSLCPSSGVFRCTHSNGICHTGLLTACEQEHLLPSVHHQEFFAVHTAVVYVIQVCWQLVSRSICCPVSSGVFRCTHSNGIRHTGLLTACEQEHLLLLTSCQQTCMTYTIAVGTVKNSWWWTEELSETCRVSIQK